MPSWELFQKQSEDYRNEVLPPNVKARLAIEAGVPFGWRDWVGEEGDIIGITKCGASAPAYELFWQYGFTVETVVTRTKKLLGK